MAKDIIKEIIIVLLLALAIILVLGVLLYEYVPSNKIVPEKISYTTPERVATELLTDTNVDDTEVIITYQIDSTDLRNYQRIQEYVPGKKNPFESIEKTEDENTQNNNNSTQNTQVNGNNTNTNTNNNNNSSNGQASTGYLPDKGTK